MKHLLIGLAGVCLLAFVAPNLALADFVGPGVNPGPNCSLPRSTLSAGDQAKCHEFDVVRRQVLRHPPKDTGTPGYIKRQIERDNTNKW